ncbi:MAG: glycosyltransferase family 9 protein [Verrucomicrobiota bacterium]
MPAALGKILVIRGGAIGDFILTLPVLSALRRSFPEVPLELLAYPRVASLALAGGLVDAVRSIDARPMASFFARNGPLPKELADYFAGFAVIFSYLFDPDRIFQENVARVSKAQFFPGPYRPDEQGHLHATAAFLQPLVRLAIFDPDPVPRLVLNHAAAAGAVQARSHGTPLARTLPGAERWLALHPGSGSERKNWPEASWQALIEELLASTGFCLLLVGGEAEGDRLNRLARLIPAGRHRLAQSQPLPELARLMAECHGFVGHDSGISHLAAAIGLPAVVLWGDTRRELWQPLGSHVRLLSSPEGLSSLSVAEVSREIESLPTHLPQTSSGQA